MLIVFTGDGKGKTTAALGQMVRAVGQGKRALMIQFIKGPWSSGEDFVDVSVRKNAKGKTANGVFKIKKTGLGFVGILDDKLPRGKHKAAAEKALAYFKKELKGGKWDVIVLDEINVAVSLRLLRVKDVLDAVRVIPEECLIILSGRGAPKGFIDRADLATEMREIKHPFNKGKLAKIGIDF